MRFEFDSKIMQLEGKIKWSVVYFPYSTLEHFDTKGNIPVCITVDGHPFDHTLLPSKKGHYLVYNEFIKQAVGKGMGDSLHITLEKDTKKRVFQTPPPIEKILREAGVLDCFLSQPDYLKREQMNFIALAKKEKTKERRLQALIKNLSEQSN